MLKNASALADKMRDMADQGPLPSNVSEMLEEAADKLEEKDKDLSVRINTAGSLLDQISNDPNIKQHTRTEIWNLASQVENLND